MITTLPAPTTPMQCPKIFISHAQDDPQWPEEAVRALGHDILGKLKGDSQNPAGLVYLDYFEGDSPNKPGDDEWLPWMHSSIEAASIILCLISPYYYSKRSERQLVNGFGVHYENKLFKEWLYINKHQHQRRIRLVHKSPFVPDPDHILDGLPQYDWVLQKQWLLDGLLVPYKPLGGKSLGGLAVHDQPWVIESQPVDSLPLMKGTEDALTSAQQELLNMLAQPIFEISHASAQLYWDVKEQSDPSRGWIHLALQRFAQLAWQSDGLAHRHYVNLLINQQETADERRRRLAGEDVRAPDSEPLMVKNLDTLLQHKVQADAWLLHGDPGSGKTTLLQNYEMKLLRNQLIERMQTRAGDAPGVPKTLCVFVPLNSMPFERDWESWLTERLKNLLDAAIPSAAERSLRHFLAMHPVQWLFDAVNELPAPTVEDREAKLQALFDWLKALPRPVLGQIAAPVVFTVRSLELMALPCDDEFKLQHAGVQPWDDAQIDEYIALRFPEQTDKQKTLNALRLNDPQGVGKLFRTPQLASAQCTLFEQTQVPATNRAMLFCGLTFLDMDKQTKWLATQNVLSAPVQKRLGRRDWMTGNWIEALPDADVTDSGVLLCFLESLALQMRAKGWRREIPERQLFLEMHQLHFQVDEIKKCLEVCERIGFLYKFDTVHGAVHWVFSHELRQEFFAARYLFRHSDPAVWPSTQPQTHPKFEATTWQLGERFYPNQASHTRWEETLKLAVQMGAPPKAWFDACINNNLPLAGRLCAAGSQAGQQWMTSCLPQVKQALLEQLTSTAPLPQRLDAGLALGAVGDDLRYEDQGLCLLPKRAYWIPVPAGRYTLGSKLGEEGSYEDELEDSGHELAAFSIAFAPVTNAEFKRFVEDGGYDKDDKSKDNHWSADGLLWRAGKLEQTGELSSLRLFRQRYLETHGDTEQMFRYYPQFKDEQMHSQYELVVKKWITELPTPAAFDDYCKLQFAATNQPYTVPHWWNDSAFNQPLQPVVGVCIYEADAYVRWLNTQSTNGLQYALPTEAQWEAAARGMARRAWPWTGGEQLLAANVSNDKFNFLGTHYRATTPVGMFAQSNTPHTPVGCTDMAGNVWEWTASQAQIKEDESGHPVLQNYLGSKPAVRASDADGNQWRVVRGGSWNDLARDARPASRSRNTLGNRLNDLGFRLVSLPMNLNPEH